MHKVDNREALGKSNDDVLRKMVRRDDDKEKIGGFIGCVQKRVSDQQG